MSHLATGSFLGHVRDQYAAAGVVLTRLDHREGRRLPRHRHGAPYLSLLLRGGYREEVPGGVLEHEPMTLVFHPAETDHCDEIAPGGGTFFMMELDAATCAAGIRRVAVQSPFASLAALRLYQQWRRGLADALCVESALPLFFTHEDELARPAWLRKLVERLHDDFRESLTVQALANDIGIHPVHAARAFRKHLGMTIGEYVARLRVATVAKRLASEEEASLADVAVDTGFADQSHMTRVFAAITGCPPGRARTWLKVES